MESKVTRLYDYTQAEIPAQLRMWRVSEEAIDRQLYMLSGSHAREVDASQVQTGDSVACQGESPVSRWNKGVLLFYPGSGLCETCIEDALPGMQVGERKTVSAGEGPVHLTVTRIVRREPHPVDDALVQLEGIEGVQTVADYRCWYRETTQARNRKDRLAHLAHHLLNEIVEKSECHIDPEEQSRWAQAVGEMEYRSAVAQGIDPTIPEDGTEFLTEEQALQKYIEMCKPLFRGEVVYPAVVEQLSGQTADAYYQAELERMARDVYHITPEALLQKVPQSLFRGQLLQGGAMHLLQEYARQLLED